MATISSLVDKVRLELGDIGKSFVTQFVADGTTDRFQLHYFPLDAEQVHVYKNNVDITLASTVEESTGILVLDDVPASGDTLSVSGNYYRYFTAAELTSLVTSAVEQHSAGHTDSLGRKMTVDTLPLVEEYPVTVYATTLALYTLATDAAFDIDIQAPDGVTIPRAERYRQLMEMINTRQAQYKDLCVQLGVGLYRIDVFTLRRVSKATGRYVPVYIPQEVDDRSYPQRVDDQLPTYGNRPTEWITEAGDLTAYQGTAFTNTFSISGSLTGYTVACRLLNQRGSVLVVQNFTMTDFLQQSATAYTIVGSLTADQTLRLAERTYWSLVKINSTTQEVIEIGGGNFFTARSSTVVI